MIEAIVFGIGGYMVWNLISFLLGFITKRFTIKTEQKIGSILMISFRILYIIYLFYIGIVRWKGIISFLILVVFHAIRQSVSIPFIVKGKIRPIIIIYLIGITIFIALSLTFKINFY